MNFDEFHRDPEIDRAASAAIVVALRASRAHSRVDDAAFDERFLPALYAELRAIAARRLAREPKGHTLQATALANEAWLRLDDQRELDLADRARFLAAAAEAVRRVLIDHARKKKAGRRGGGVRRVTFDEDAVPGRDSNVDLVSLEDALAALAVHDSRQARIVRLRVFAGMTVEEIATLLEVSPRTVKGDFAMARGWLKRRLGANRAEHGDG